MRGRRILVLTHESYVIPETLDGLSDQQVHDIKTDWDVVTTLRELGHDVQQLGVVDSLKPIRTTVEKWKPHIVFNLVESFHHDAMYDHAVVAYLQLLKVPYTGCGPRGLVLARDKALAKKLVTYHRVRIPRFFVVRRGHRPQKRMRLGFPLIVKSLMEEASLSIAKASVVHNEEKLGERVRFVHEHVESDALVEEFIEGREIYVAILGNHRLQVLPPQELLIEELQEGEPLIATEKVKHDARYQEERGVSCVTADLGEAQLASLSRTAKRIYRTLELRGYARMDFRLSPEGEFYFLEANPNPEIADDEEVARSARVAGIEYGALLEKIVRLGLRGG